MSILQWWKNLWSRPLSSSAYTVKPGVVSDIGVVRKNNEDSVQYVVPQPDDPRSARGLLAIVADGMGGHAAGEVASKMAIECIAALYYADSGPIAKSLTEALHQANRQIYEKAQSDPDLKGMGTTCTAMVLHSGRAYLAHAGDSRMYLVRDGQITLESQDHSFVMQMVRQGLLSLEEARSHPDRNLLLNALGTKPECEVWSPRQPIAIKHGDQFVLCSDGLFDLIEDDEIKSHVCMDEPFVACNKLVALARSRGGHDNITVGIFSIQPPENETEVSRDTREVEASA